MDAGESQPHPPAPTDARADAIARVQGKYASVLASVEAFLARKEEEVRLEERRWLARSTPQP